MVSSLLSENAITINSDGTTGEAVWIVVETARLHELGAGESVGFTSVVIEIIAVGRSGRLVETKLTPVIGSDIFRAFDRFGG